MGPREGELMGKALSLPPAPAKKKLAEVELGPEPEVEDEDVDVIDGEETNDTCEDDEVTGVDCDAAVDATRWLLAPRLKTVISPDEPLLGSFDDPDDEDDDIVLIVEEEDELIMLPLWSIDLFLPSNRGVDAFDPAPPATAPPAPPAMSGDNDDDDDDDPDVDPEALDEARTPLRVLRSIGVRERSFVIFCSDLARGIGDSPPPPEPRRGLTRPVITCSITAAALTTSTCVTAATSLLRTSSGSARTRHRLNGADSPTPVSLIAVRSEDRPEEREESPSGGEGTGDAMLPAAPPAAPPSAPGVAVPATGIAVERSLAEDESADDEDALDGSALFLSSAVAAAMTVPCSVVMIVVLGVASDVDVDVDATESSRSSLRRLSLSCMSIALG